MSRLQPQSQSRSEGTVTPTGGVTGDSARRLTVRTTLGTAVAVVLALALRTVAVETDPTLAGLDPFDPLAVAGSAVVAGVGAAVVYAAAVRFTARPVTAFVAVAAVVFLGMLLPVVLVAPGLGVEGAAQLWLVGLHVAVAVTLVVAVVGRR